MNRMENNVKFSENVILIDVAFLNDTVTALRSTLTKRLERELPLIDLPACLTCLALDAGLREGDNDIQVLLLHDENVSRLTCCQPAGLKELDGKACRTELGEFSFACVTPAGMAAAEELFLDLTALTIDAAGVKRVLLVPNFLQYQDRVEEALGKLLKDKTDEEKQRAFCFALRQLEELPCPWDFINYSLLHVLGIKAEELRS